MLSVGWFSFMLFPLLSALFGFALVAALERSRRLTAAAFVLLLAVLSSLLVFEHGLLSRVTGGG